MNEEIWNSIPGFGDFYEASSLGRVRSKTRTITKFHAKAGAIRNFSVSGKLLKQHLRSDGHLIVSGSFYKKRFSLLVHRAVLLAFVGLPSGKEEGCHNNGIASDNCIKNLRWDTHANNMKDKPMHENAQRGETHATAKVTEKDAKKIIDGTISIKEAAHNFGIDPATARSIKRGTTWKHLHRKLKEQASLL